MSLVLTVVTHTLIGAAGLWHEPGSDVNIPTTCHFATMFWLFRTQYDRDPTLNDIVDMSPIQATVGKMIPYAVRKNRPANGPLTLTMGSVLVFNTPLSPGHSCVATGPHVTAGYNQTGWWELPGVKDGFSSHQTTQLRWGKGADKDRVVSGGKWYELYEVPETAALQVLRDATQ
jgi:hypothetical protein